jgi:hypothetical protein
MSEEEFCQCCRRLILVVLGLDLLPVLVVAKCLLDHPGLLHSRPGGSAECDAKAQSGVLSA